MSECPKTSETELTGLFNQKYCICINTINQDYFYIQFIQFCSWKICINNKFRNISGILLGGSLTVKNQWGLIIGDGEVGLVKKYNIRVHRLCVRSLRARAANNQVSVQVSIRNYIQHISAILDISGEYSHPIQLLNQFLIILLCGKIVTILLPAIS